MPKNDFSRLLQKGDMSVRPYPGNALEEARAATLDALILNPNMPAVHLAESIMKEADKFCPLRVGHPDGLRVVRDGGCGVVENRDRLERGYPPYGTGIPSHWSMQRQFPSLPRSTTNTAAR